jgi:chemotaxis protein CheX
MSTTDKSLTQASRAETWPPMIELATREVFEMMLGSRLETASDLPVTPAECTSMVGLAGQLCGVMTLRTSAQAANLMASKMLGIPVSEVDQQMWDAIGEVCNMVAGNFKNKLTGVSEHCALSVPTVITGGDYHFHSLADGESFEVTVLFEGQPIVVSLALHT